MNTLLPDIDLYLALYLVTLALHFAIIAFPLGGSVLLCLFEIFRGQEISHLRNLISRHLAMSIGLGITAGVAPLLFLEIVHPHAFYNAGAILGVWRVALLAPLIIAFYLAYLQKTESFRRWPGIVRLPIRIVGLVCLSAVGSIWMISRRVGEEASLWQDRYLDLQITELLISAIPGIGLVLGAATLGCTIGCLWLLGSEARSGRLSPGERFAAEETLLRLAIFVGVAIAIVCEILRIRADRPVDLDWWIFRASLFVTVAGLGIRLHRIGPGRLIATIGASAGLFMVLILREIARREHLVDGGGYEMRTREIAAERGGFIAFLISAIICFTAIGAVIRMVRRIQPPVPDEDEETTTVEEPA